ncbi:MAG: hypothetical protein IKI20_07645 [Lachnospiraceae bacterium]|nr:hypothetical protein [Lachnospiraceae bacterium]
MKIQCEYCGSMFDDTLENCPGCGAPNKNVRRSTPDQPTTIGGLQAWYQSKGLPPEEVTRFFIGKNYTEPRAFGIYKDEITGNFIVYKNKADGTRAIRYEGTDEAYAVNELHTRLKQEILQQKANGNRSGSSSRSGGGRRNKSSSIASGVIVALMTFLFAVMGITRMNEAPSRQGYYSYNEKTYYHYGSDKYGWAVWDKELGDWKKTDTYGISPITTRKKSKKYYLSADYNQSYGVTDFLTSQVNADLAYGFQVNRGYYNYGNDIYYHMHDDQNSGWYIFDYDDNDWRYTTSTSVPNELQHQTSAQDFWYTPTWDESTQYTDFEETETYKEYVREEAERERYESTHTDSDDDYSWDSGNDSWDSGTTDWDSDW